LYKRLIRSEFGKLLNTNWRNWRFGWRFYKRKTYDIWSSFKGFQN